MYLHLHACLIQVLFNVIAFTCLLIIGCLVIEATNKTDY